MSFDLFLTVREKERLTRSQKQAGRKQYAPQSEDKPESEPGRHALDMTRQELADLQQSDDTLKACIEKQLKEHLVRPERGSSSEMN